MDLLSHFLIGILTGMVLLHPLGLPFVILCGVMAALPDFDAFLSPLRKFKDTYYFYHRGGSHSYFTAAAVSFVVGWIFFGITGQSFLLAWLIGFLFYSLHLTLDYNTAFNTPLLYPVVKNEYRFNAERAVNFILMFFSLGIIILYIVLFFVKGNQNGGEFNSIFYFNLSLIIWLIFMVYLGYRIITKVYVSHTLPADRYFLPGLFPFVYYIYEAQKTDEKLSFKLTKKFQFTNKSLVLMETEIKKDSEEMQLYEIGLNSSKDSHFFSKWEYFIPAFITNNSEIRFLLFFAESVFSSRSYTFEVDFDKETKKIIKITDGFKIVDKKALMNP